MEKEEEFALKCKGGASAGICVNCSHYISVKIAFGD